MQLKYVIIIFSIFGVLSLYGLSLLTQPEIISLTDIEQYEGKTVIAIGRVHHHSTTTYGSQFITIQTVNTSENLTQAIVFTEHPIIIRSGDIIQATGTVQQYENDWEIITNSEKDILVIECWNNTKTPLWELAEYPQFFIGTSVNISGMVDRVYDSYFYLIDNENTYTLFVSYDPYDHQEVYPGQHIEVTGDFVYDETQYRYQLEVTQYHYLRVMEESP